MFLIFYHVRSDLCSSASDRPDIERVVGGGGGHRGPIDDLRKCLNFDDGAR